MSFRNYTVCFWSLLACGLLLIVSAGLVAMFAPVVSPDTKRTLAAWAMIFVAAAFVTNAIAGLNHGRLWARGGVTTKEDQGRWFPFMVAMNVLVAALAIWTSYRIWSGAVSVFA